MRRAFHRRGEGSHPVKAEITVTSLVDVAFTLLVIFIITAPILQGGVEVQVPRADVAPITSREGLVVTVKEDGTIFVEDTPVEADAFAREFPGLLESAGAEIVYVRGDAGARYESVLRVIASVARTEGIRYGLVAEPAREGTP